MHPAGVEDKTRGRTWSTIGGSRRLGGAGTETVAGRDGGPTLGVLEEPWVLPVVLVVAHRHPRLSKAQTPMRRCPDQPARFLSTGVGCSGASKTQPLVRCRGGCPTRAQRVRVTEIRLRYFDGCPHWQAMHDRLGEALRAEGAADLEPILERVETPEDAERLRFIGSPTILVDGRDPFAEGTEASFGLTCRVYQTPDGLAGTPTVEQLRTALRAA